VLILLLVIVVVFFILRWVGRNYFTGSYRADVFALAVVIAFAIGVFGPFGRSGGASQATPPVASAPTAAIPPPPPPHDVAAICASVTKPVGKGAGYIDVIGAVNEGKLTIESDGFSLPRRAGLEVVGWASDGSTKIPAEAACLTIDHVVRHDATAIYGQNRPDVAAAFQAPVLAGTGYQVGLPATALKPGMHTIGIVVLTARGAGTLVLTRKVHVL
jgi:hypothetical protein